MRHNKKIFCYQFLLLSIVLLLFIGCSNDKNQLENMGQKITDVYNNVLSQYDKLLVINKDYARVFYAKDVNSDVIDFVRRGEVLYIKKVSGKDDDGFIWYYVTKEFSQSSFIEGWVLLYDAILVNSIEQAKYISLELQKEKKQETKPSPN